MAKPPVGTVYLVGAGPGDAGLLTLRGAELLGRADVVVHDALVNADLLRLAPRSAEVIYGGKRARDHALPQDELSRLLVERARAGATVVRLKGGDPYLFGRGGEEAEELAAAGVPFEVVPGVSSFFAAPNYAGIPITHRGHCSSFTVVTGHEDPAKPDTAVDWGQLARLPGTKVVLMGVERLREITAALLAGGAAADTPAALVRWGTTGRQESLDAPLGGLAEAAERAQFAAPAVLVIGGVVGLRGRLNWFEHRPLFGRRVVVTRTREQAGELSRRLRELGADVLEIPTIRITAPTHTDPLKDAILGLNGYDWLVFTSPNGVTAFFDLFFRGFDDLRDLGGCRLAAVGPATAAKLKELHLKVDVMPERYVAAEVADAIGKYMSVENLRVLLLRAEKANAELPQRLEELGAIVDDVAVYRTVPETEDADGAAARLLAEGADWVTFTSSSTVEHFHARFSLPALKEKFPELRLLSIGPETTKALEALGLRPDAEARPHNLDGMVAALTRAARAKPQAGLARP
jgi:uroporphyrinogen III methyltransferase/synthase